MILKTKTVMNLINIKELTLKARQANLVDYLESRGYSFIRKGNRHRCVEHSSLVITNGNAFFWNSKQEHGNSVDFLIKYLNMDFKTAIKELTNTDLEHKKSPLQPQTVKSNYIVTKNYLNRAYGYLNKQRCIENTIISNLIKKGYMKMLTGPKYKYPVIGFTILDKNKQVVGYELQGTFDKVRFKGLTEDSKYGYGFNFAIGEPEKAYFFESAIDLLSFYQLWKHGYISEDLNSSLLASMSGLKVSTLTNTLSAFKIDSVASVCIDNDIAAMNFKKTLTEQKISFKSIEVPNKKYKDWNDYLKYVERA